MDFGLHVGELFLDQLVGVHSYITGVPHRIKYFERLLEELAARPGVLFWTGDRILDWYKAEKAEAQEAAE